MAPIEEKFPKLRFKKYSESWIEKSIRELLTIGSGKDYKHLGEGDIPVYGSGGHMSNVDRFLFDGKSVTIGRKGTIDSPKFLDGKFWTVDTLFYTHSFNGVIPEHVYSIFLKVNWKKYNEASGVPSLSKSTIESIKICYSNDLNEQQNIADFLSAVDQKISLLKDKNALLEQYKKGVMQKLFTQEIRFKDENGNDFPDWQTKVVGDFMKESRIKGNTGANAKKITVKLWGKGVFEKQEKMIGSENTQYYRRKSGQFIYSKLDFLNCAFGIIPNHLDGFETTVDLPCFDVSQGINKYLILEFIKQKRFYKKYGDMADGSRKAKRIHAKDFLSFPLDLPCEEEQNKIADFLEALDKKLEQIERQIELTQTFKKGLLQQMFV
ncbi:restriction endonuclease subunit S [Thalassomonas viridans]|uniref:Restriction endonuclease subunit S n=1 Tax=Thalassomonas viridans TaxID=137584 RepID=A0AAE9Z705_9GAMM|nr:restriction endonuclease subunit S [Thalassomonas viridans]WDE07941.1 restriction endonuclease subunit S [Thalassomonas viridans]